MRSIDERIGGIESAILAAINALRSEMRVALPGIIQSFDSRTQTVVVQCAIREKIISNSKIQDIEIPLLVDVPIVTPRAGGYSLLVSPKSGDECLVIFSDLCIDSWWQSGGLQNQADSRRHDFSDGFAVLGTWSQPNVIADYPATGIEMRSDDGTSGVSVRDGTTSVWGDHVCINGAEIIMPTAKSHFEIVDGVLYVLQEDDAEEVFFVDDDGILWVDIPDSSTDSYEIGDDGILRITIKGGF